VGVLVAGDSGVLVAVGAGTLSVSVAVGAGMLSVSVAVGAGMLTVPVGVGGAPIVPVAVGAGKVPSAVGVLVGAAVGQGHQITALGVCDGVREGTTGGADNMSARVLGRFMIKVRSALGSHTGSLGEVGRCLRPGDWPSPRTTTTRHRCAPGRSMAEVIRSLRSWVQK